MPVKIEHYLAAYPEEQRFGQVRRIANLIRETPVAMDSHRPLKRVWRLVPPRDLHDPQPGPNQAGAKSSRGLVHAFAGVASTD